jgi:hypothetical protein
VRLFGVAPFYLHGSSGGDGDRATRDRRGLQDELVRRFGGPQLEQEPYGLQDSARLFRLRRRCSNAPNRSRRYVGGCGTGNAGIGLPWCPGRRTGRPLSSGPVESGAIHALTIEE